MPSFLACEIFDWICRGVADFSGRATSFIARLTTASWSSESKTTKPVGTPASSGKRRRSRTPHAWNVPTKERGRSVPRSARDALLHLARGLVRERDGDDASCGTPCATSHARRRVRTRVFPDPAPARTRSGPSPCETAAACSGLRPSRRSSGRATKGRDGSAAAARPPALRQNRAAAMPFVLALDQGTTSSRALVFDHGGRASTRSPGRSSGRSIPQPGWVDHVAGGASGRRVGRRPGAREARRGLSPADDVAACLGSHGPSSGRLSSRTRDRRRPLAATRIDKQDRTTARRGTRSCAAGHDADRSSPSTRARPARARSSSTAAGAVRGMAQQEFRQIYPEPGWVEHDPTEIWATQSGVMHEALAKAGLTGPRRRGDRHHEPARDDAPLGARDGPSARERDRLAGPPDRADVRRAPRGRPRGDVHREDGPRPRPLLLRHEAEVAARPRAGGTGARAKRASSRSARSTRGSSGSSRTAPCT